MSPQIKRACLVDTNTDVCLQRSFYTFFFKTDMTFKGVMDRASSTTIPFGWDDAENSSTMKQVAVAFFNQVRFLFW